MSYIKIDDNRFYDGNGCYNRNHECICADCFYHSGNITTCAYTTADGPIYQWDGKAFSKVNN